MPLTHHPIKKTVVTRYPTGCFGIDYDGQMFYWWSFDEAEIHKKLAELKVPKRLVKWQERYYKNSRYVAPSNYALRPYTPKHTP